MFGPVILPFFFTVFVLGVLFVGITYSLTQRSESVAAGMAVGFAVCFLMFLPTIVVVGLLVDGVRYGEFSYATASQVRDINMPDDATGIVIHRYASGHATRCVVTHASLKTWMAGVTARRRSHSDATPFVQLEADDWRMHKGHWEFDRYNWLRPGDVICYEGWHARTGAGFDVWYSPSQKTAYIRAGYW